MDTSNKDELAQIPLCVYEDVADRYERTQKRLVVALVFAILAIICLSVMIYLTNRTWARVWSEFEVVADDESVDLRSDGGDANYIGERGVIINGVDNY